jgi:hypothetical protein
MPLTVAGQKITASLLSLDYAQADANSHTQATASYVDISSAYTVPAGDALVGTCYRITCAGTGTWGSTQQDMGINQLFGPSGNISHLAFSASAAFNWSAVCTWVIVTTGVSGTVNGWFDVTATETASVPDGLGAATNTLTVTRSASGTTYDTTAAQVLALQTRWASTTGSPTMTCTTTTFEKLGG